MHNVLFQTICRTGIFMICAQTIVHFRPNESYEKYLKLLVSVMVLIQLFLPVGVFIAGVDGTGGSLDEFRESLEQSMEEARQQAARTEEILEQMTLEEVRSRIEEQAAEKSQAGLVEQENLDGQSQSLEEQKKREDGIKSVELPPVDVNIAPIGGGLEQD